MTTPDKSHIGRRVKWFRGGESGYGYLKAINLCRGSLIFQLVEDSSFAHSFTVTSYELMNEPMTLENMVEGTIIRDESGFYRRVLAVLGGEGELRTYALSYRCNVLDSVALKGASNITTAYQLKTDNYTIYTPEAQTEVSLEEIAKWKGVDVSKIRVKE